MATEIRKRLSLPAKGPAVFAQNRLRAPSTQVRPAHAPQERRREGHEALLKALSGQKTQIAMVLLDGEEIEGRLDQSDRYTITVYQSCHEGYHDTPTIVFKHAIKFFDLDTSANQKGE